MENIAIINDIVVKVGQRWGTVGGAIVTIVKVDTTSEWPIKGHSNAMEYCCLIEFRANGQRYGSGTSSSDLIRLMYDCSQHTADWENFLSNIC